MKNKSYWLGFIGFSIVQGLFIFLKFFNLINIHWFIILLPVLSIIIISLVVLIICIIVDV
jgi:hypothetical protein